MRIKNVVLTLKMPKKFDFLMQFAVLILILFGTLMIVSTNVGNTTKDPYIIPKTGNSFCARFIVKLFAKKVIST